MPLAITRQVAATINDCQLVELTRTPIDVARARQQHDAYCDLLRTQGWQVTSLPAEDRWPDSVFVEDTAIVLDEVAILTRPGANSRRNEVEPIAKALSQHRNILRIQAPATLDGGDVIVQGKRIWIGQTTRTNAHAVDQMQSLLAPFGYEVIPVPVTGVMHLKSAATAVGERIIAVNPAWVDRAFFAGCDLIETPPDEPNSANILDLGACAVVPADCSEMKRRLEKSGVACLSLEADELAKAEGALTCCSLLLRD